MTIVLYVLPASSCRLKDAEMPGRAVEKSCPPPLLLNEEAVHRHARCPGSMPKMDMQIDGPLVCGTMALSNSTRTGGSSFRMTRSNGSSDRYTQSACWISTQCGFSRNAGNSHVPVIRLSSFASVASAMPSCVLHNVGSCDSVTSTSCHVVVSITGWPYACAPS